MSHSPEPAQFTVDSGTASQLRIVCGDKIIALIPVADGGTYEATTILAERIVACVNACRQFTSEQLAMMADPEIQVVLVRVDEPHPPIFVYNKADLSALTSPAPPANNQGGETAAGK